MKNEDVPRWFIWLSALAYGAFVFALVVVAIFFIFADGAS